MFYTIYKITNQINGKFYIGSHKTKDLNDNYMGSGKYLKYAQEKHGIENFTKEILFIFDNSEEMYAKEAEIVNENFLSEENTYNIKIGGFGGWDHVNDGSEEHIQRCITARSLRKDYSTGGFSYGDNARICSNKGREVIREKYENWTFGGKFHTTETKNLISAKAKDRLSDPQKNSQFGTVWITNGIENRKIKKDSKIPEQWRLGRIMK